jgi:hypothetical protein
VKPTGEYVLLRQAAEEGYPPLPPRFNSKMFTVIIDLPLGANAQAVAQGLKDATNADRTLGDHLFAGARARPADACGREDDIQPRVEMSITIGG